MKNQKRVIYEKWIPAKYESPEGTSRSARKLVAGTGCYQVGCPGVFLEWGERVIESSGGVGSYTVALIRCPDGTVDEVDPSKVKFIDPHSEKLNW